MFDAIVGVLSVFMILLIVVATVDCVVKMWPVKPFVDESTNRQRVSQGFSFQIAQLEATVSDRDKPLSALLSETQSLRGLIEGHKQTIAELREQSIRSTEHNNALRHENTKLHRKLDTLRKAFRELELNVETRGGQVPDLNTAWHMTDKPLDVKQKYLLDDTPLDDDGSGVVDSKPYGE
jgi:predicted RNase H-like nuclease (RuvC/YqgF family)